MPSHLLSSLALCLLLTTPALAQQANFQNFSVKDGLAQSQVYSIAEAQNGYLWIGTRGGGLCQFDGIGFETFTQKDGLPSNYINHLYFDRSGQLWITTNKGLCTLSDGKIASLDFEPKFSSITANTLYEDQSGKLWIGTEDGLYHFEDSMLTKLEMHHGDYELRVSSIVEHDSLGLWVGTNRGLYHIAEDTIRRYLRRDGLISEYVLSLEFDQRGNLWVGTYGRGISVMTASGFTRPKLLNGVRSSIIHDLLQDAKGNTWICTLAKGLVKWNPTDSTATYFDESVGLANNHTRCLHEDTWGNLWIGTSGGGISKYSGQHFEQYNAASTGLKSNYIFAIEAISDQDIWVSTSGLGVNRYHKGRTMYYGADSGFVDAKVKAIHQSDSSTVWFGTEGKGLYYYDGKRFASAGFNRELGSGWIRDIKTDTSQNLWVATSGGGITKVQIDRTSRRPIYTTTHFDRDGLLEANRISCIHIDQENKVWFAYQSGGLGYIESDTIVYHVTSVSTFSTVPIRSMAEDAYGYLWLGTAVKGVYSLKLYEDSLVFANFSTDAHLGSDNIYLLDTDTEHNLWIGSEKGVEKAKLDGEGNLLEVTSYGYDEGFSGVETSRNAISVDSLGGIWIGTINGLFRYNASYQRSNDKPPFLSITDVSLFYASVKETIYADYQRELTEDSQAKITLKYHQNHISFDFKGLLLTQPNQVKYKWRLEGLESEWSPSTAKNSITYANLAPGQYRFEVLSSNEDGVWNSQPQVVAFEILIPFWRTVWFAIAVVTSALALIALTVWLRFKAVQRKAQATQELLQMENEMLVFQQKALRLQMNPHFIFNCLNSIQSMIVKRDHKTARFFLSRFSKLMRKTLDNSREELITLDDEIETLEHYLSIEKFCNEDHFDYTIEVADGIASDFVQMPPMLIQPFVENAIVHGVRHRTSDGHVSVRFSLEDKLLTCTVEDNGVGRIQSAQLNQNRDGSHKSTALIVIQERLTHLGKNTTIKPLEVQDLYDTDQTPCGTRVTLRLKMED
jgi:ligand-binding sensor domain-containing protein